MQDTEVLGRWCKDQDVFLRLERYDLNQVAFRTIVIKVYMRCG